MPRPGVEYEAVERIARQLMSQGQHPSVQKVRDILGTGSNTTIANHLKAWQASFAASNSPTLPESVPEDLMNPLDEFWNLALARAEANYQKYKAELEANLVTTEAAKDEALDQLVEKTQALETVQGMLADTELKVRDTERQLQKLKGEYSVTASELAHAHVELERMHTLLQAQEKRFESEQTQMLKEHAEALQYERNRATETENWQLQEIDKLRQNAKNLEAVFTRQQKDNQALQQQHQQRELASQQQITELTASNQQLESMQQQNKQALEMMNNQLAAVQEQLSKSLETVEALRKALEQSKDNEIKQSAEIRQLKVLNTQLQSSKRAEHYDHPPPHQ